MRIRTHEDAKNYVRQYGYELLTEYTGTKNRVTFKCPVGHEYTVRFTTFKEGRRCRSCVRKEIKRRNDDVLNKAKNLCKENNLKFIELEEKREGASYIVTECSKGHRYTRPWMYFKDDPRCIPCSGFKHTNWDTESVREYFKEKGYTLHSEYGNSQDKLLTTCPQGHRYKVTLNTFIAGSRCGICKGSSGEKVVYEVLHKLFEEGHINNIEMQYYVKMSGGRYFYDFMVETPYHKQVFIEFDGQQHYDPKKQFTKSPEAFTNVVKSDHIKDLYAHFKKAYIIRIRYDTRPSYVEKYLRYILLAPNLDAIFNHRRINIVKHRLLSRPGGYNHEYFVDTRLPVDKHPCICKQRGKKKVIVEDMRDEDFIFDPENPPVQDK